MTGDRLLTAEDVADILGLRAEYVRNLSRRGEIPTVRIGRYRRFRRSTIDEWARNREGSGARPVRAGGKAA